jgi:hypothetical protein
MLAGGIAATSVGVLYAFSPSEYSFYPRCPIYSATRLLCPGCGATRALHELLHLNLRGALHYNALTTLLIPIVLTWSALEWHRASRQNRSMELRLPVVTWAALLLVAVLFTIIRNTGLAFAI